MTDRVPDTVTCERLLQPTGYSYRIEIQESIKVNVYKSIASIISRKNSVLFSIYHHVDASIDAIEDFRRKYKATI